MGLKNPLHLFRRDLPSIIHRVDRLSEGFATLRTFESLISVARAIVFMGFRMVTVGTLHEASPDSTGSYDEAHVCLVHNHWVWAFESSEEVERQAYPDTLASNTPLGKDLRPDCPIVFDVTFNKRQKSDCKM